ncbi:hypothetical protein WR25_19354 [Diploscapter pachys]|uniref:Uncharacterized protein n=1 Tax=Diploscapter pachys TaxID=2018661 RepID=A0A2A2J1E1_9BILA|nr:hypothetical protein WR25_19354 [Diploscapter pachys]
MAEKVFEQCQQMEKKLIEETKLDREAARERANNHSRQLEVETRQFQENLEEKSRSRNAGLEEQQQNLETERAKIKEERERADADTQKKTQEHQERIKTQSQEHVMNFQGRKELRDDAKEYKDRASADHLRNVDTQKDGLTHMREQQKEQIDRKVEDMNQTKNRQIEEQTRAEQKIEVETAENRATMIETLQLQINSSMALIDAANISTEINSHVTTYDNTLVRCSTSGLTCIKESSQVKLELFVLVLKLGTFFEACKNPTAADSKYWTSDEGKEKIEDMCSRIENFCEKALSSLDELQSICSTSASSLSTNPSLSADLRKTYKSHLYQVSDAARKLYGAVYMTKINMDNYSSFTINELKVLDNELENGIKELRKELNDIPEAQGTDGLREQLKVLEEIVKDSADRLAEINQRESEKAVKDSADRPAEIDQRESEKAVEDSTDQPKEIDQHESEKIDTSAQGNAIQDGDE